MWLVPSSDFSLCERMAKRRVKNTVDNLTAARPRPTKTRRRECPTKTVDSQANLQNIAGDAFIPEEPTVILAVDQQKMEHQLLVTEGDVGDMEVTDVSANTNMATVTEVEPTAFANAHDESQSELSLAPMNNDISQNGDNEEVIVVAENSILEPHSSLQVIQGPQTASEDQQYTHESCHCGREKDQHNSCCDSDVKKTTVETQMFLLPAMKKSRIEIFHQVKAVSPGPPSEFFKIEAAVQTEAVGGDGNDGIQAEVHGDRPSAVVGPAQEGQSCKDKDGVVDSPQECGDTRSDQGAGQEDQEQQQLDGDPVEHLSAEPPQQTRGVEAVDHSPTTGLNSISLENQAAEDSDAAKITPLLASCDTNVAGDAGEGSSWAETSSGGCAVGPAAPSLGSEKKESLDVDDDRDTRSSFRSREPCRVKGSREVFGPGYLDYVSDSQLNTIPLTEEEILKEEKDLGSPDCPDGSDLICGLIKELSWLNRKVMATHRELENMRRSTKSLRSSTR